MPPTPFWAKPNFVHPVILLYLAVHFAIRMAMWPTLATDDAEQALFSQHFAWAYRYRAPPLFTWLLVALGEVMPVGAVAISLLRYALLGVTYVFAYLTARRLIDDPRFSALAVFSFAAIHTFAESSHRELTHTTTLAALLSVAWYVFARLCAAPRLGWYLALGGMFGLGMLAKWNFVVLAAALPLACLMRSEFRPLALTWKVVPAAALAAAIVLPTVVATLGAGPPPGENVEAVFSADAERGLAQITRGTFQLLHTAIIYPEPFLLVLLIVLGLPLWRGLRAGKPHASAAPPRPDAAFVGLSMAVGLALIWVLVPAIGATEFKVRYVYPALFVLPTFLFMLIERGRPAPLAVRAFAVFLLAAAILVPVDRVREALSAENCGLCLDRAPFGPLAVALAGAGYNGTGTIIADGVYTGGNLRVEFPGARVLSPGFAPSVWPAPADNGPCLLVWDNTDAPRGGPPSALTYLLESQGADPDLPHRDGNVSAPHYANAARLFRMGYRLYDAAAGDCR